MQLSLRDALSMGLANNNRIKAAGFQSLAAHQGVESVQARYLPTVSLEETLIASNAPVATFMMKLDEGRFTDNDFRIGNLNSPAAAHDFKTVLSIQQPLFVPSLSPLKEMAVKDAQQAELGLEAVRQGVAFEVFSRYLEVQKAAAHLKAVDQAIADARENLRLATARTAVGTGLRSDELRARTHQALVEQLQITANNNLALSRLKLAQLIGLPEDDTFAVAGEIAGVTVPPMSDQLLGATLQQRVDVRQSQANLEKTAAALGLARSEYLPTVGTFASYQLNARDLPFTADNDAWTAGVTLKWNIFDGFRRSSEQKRAVADQSAARELLDATNRDARYQLRESYLRRQEAVKRQEVASHALQDAEETVRLLGRRYENSLATMVELLDAQTALNQARANLVETEAGHALAGGRIYYSAGIFVKEMLK
jgi:outer membrane protein TolC